MSTPFPPMPKTVFGTCSIITKLFPQTHCNNVTDQDELPARVLRDIADQIALLLIYIFQ